MFPLATLATTPVAEYYIFFSAILLRFAARALVLTSSM